MLGDVDVAQSSASNRRETNYVDTVKKELFTFSLFENMNNRSQPGARLNIFVRVLVSNPSFV